MKIYNVGPDELTDYGLKYMDGAYKWLVYWYEIGGYDGSGEAVALREDGMLVVKNLGHCSCYGPMEDWATGSSVVSRDEYLRKKEDIHDLTVMEAVDEKVRKLLARKR